MIPIERIYIRINEDLVMKGKGAYTSTDRFNRDIRDMQHILQNYYFDRMGSSGVVMDALLPFQKEKPIQVVNQYCDFPPDYKHWVDCAYMYMLNTSTVPTTELIGMYFETSRFASLNHPIRKPSIADRHLTYSFVNGRIHVPSLNFGYIRFNYIKQPPVAERAYTVNVTTIEEDYDAANSTDLVWPDQEETNILTVLMMMKGIEMKDTQLSQFIQSKKQLETVAGR